jgi:DnaJ-class molecular chaperone
MSTCSICGGSGTIYIQKIINGKVVQVPTPCPSSKC